MQEDPHIRSRLVGVNIPAVERIATAVAGGLAIAVGLRQRSVVGFLGAGLGTMVLARAVTGNCPVARARAIQKGVQIRRAVTIQCTPKEVYELWRDLTNLPKFMQHVTSVTIEDGGVSRWVVREGRKQLAWRAEITEDTPNRRLRWKSLPGGDIDHEGTLDIREAAGDRGTVVEVKIHYFPPGGIVVASTMSGFLRKVTQHQLGIELARLQQLLETGEISVGARRVEDLDGEADQKARSAAQLVPDAPAPFTSAQTSDWDAAPHDTLRSPVLGGES